MASANVAKASVDTGPTDLYALWQKAFVAYNRNLGKNAKAVTFETLPKVLNLQGVIAEVDAAEKKFTLHRHSGSRLEKLRTAVGEQLGLVQSIGDVLVSGAVVVSDLRCSKPILLTAMPSALPASRCHLDCGDICDQGKSRSYRRYI